MYNILQTYIYISIHTAYGRYAFICYLATPGLFAKSQDRGLGTLERRQTETISRESMGGIEKQVSNETTKNRLLRVYGGFLKWWYLITMGFPTKNDHFGEFGGTTI